MQIELGNANDVRIPAWKKRLMMVDREFIRSLRPSWIQAIAMRLAWRLGAVLRIDSLFEVESGSGIKMLVNKTDAIDRFIYYFGEWEPIVCQMMRMLLRKGDFVVDIGANIGHHTVVAAKLIGSTGKVIAFEPSLENWNRANANVVLNDLNNVDLRRSAIGSDEGFAELFSGGEFHSGRRSLIETGATGASERVDMQRLSVAIPKEVWPKVRLIKIDVEGAEPLVVSSFGDIVPCLPEESAILVEFDASSWINARVGNAQLGEYLAGAGYQVFHLNNYYGAFAYARRDRLALTKLVDLTAEREDVLFLRGKQMLERARPFCVRSS